MLFKLPTCSSARASMVSPIAAFDHKTAKNRNPKYQRIRQSKHWEMPSKMFCIKITMVIKMGRCGFKISNNPYLWEISQSLGDCWPPQKKTVMQWFPDNNKGHSNKHESRYGVHLSMDCFIRRPLHFHWALFQNIPKCMTQTRTWRRIFFQRGSIGSIVKTLSLPNPCRKCQANNYGMAWTTLTIFSGSLEGSLARDSKPSCSHGSAGLSGPQLWEVIPTGFSIAFWTGKRYH